MQPEPHTQPEAMCKKSSKMHVQKKCYDRESPNKNVTLNW